ncbi:MAG TPA: hypothetical protein VFK05_15425 [Polyangiaceae bacterium]|nr:hypothetical protein [Polyangiaceae bacterium]
MFIAFMSSARLLVPLLTLGLGLTLPLACGSDDRPGSLVSFGAEAGRGSGTPGNTGGSSGEGGQAPSDAGSNDHDDAGAAGEGIPPPAPRAIFPEQLQADVGCGSSPESSSLLIRNDGLLPLIISSATASAGYVVKSELPLEIAAMTAATLELSPPAPKGTAAVGDQSSGTLSFVTNEPGNPTHEVQLNTTLFGGRLEFSDGDGTALSGALPLTYLSSTNCPDRVKYRVRNTGNVAFSLFGPTFPAHFGGTSTGESGLSVAPNEYVELEVGANSTADGACSGSGDLIFTVQGSVCGKVPKLAVIWPTNTKTSGCTCATAD